MRRKTAVLLLPLLLSAALCLPCAAADGVPVPILMYHEVKDDRPGKDAIQPWELENDLRWLAENGYTAVTMAELVAYVYGGAPLPERPVVLSFDDGYLNNYVNVLPLLRHYRAKIVLSLLGKNTDDFTEHPSSSLDYAHVTWTQLNEMLDSGLVEVQNHSYNLHGFTSRRIGCRQRPGESDAAYERLLTEDVEKLQDELFLRTGRVPQTFAYPYGAYSDLADAVLRELGFRATLTCDFGVNMLTDDPDCLFRLKRICRAHGHGAAELLTEAYRTLR